MRRLRPISRRRREREAEQPLDESLEVSAGEDLRPFVPVESYSPPDEFVTAADPSNNQFADPYSEEYERAPRPRRPVLRAPRPAVNFGALVVVLLLIAAGVIGTLLTLDRIELSVPDEWPAVVLLVAVVWLIAALSRQRVTPALGAAALAGVGLSALLDTQGIAAWRETMLGAVLVALGLGIVIRGLVLRQRAPA